jgi:hypothetical protein
LRRAPTVEFPYQHGTCALRLNFIAALRERGGVLISDVVSIPVELKQPNVYLARINDIR